MSDIPIASLEVTRYRLVDSTKYGGHNIIIEQVKALDQEGRYIKFLPLAKAVALFPMIPVKWKWEGRES